MRTKTKNRIRNQKQVTVLKKVESESGWFTYIPQKKITMKEVMDLIPKHHREGNDSLYIYKYVSSNREEIYISVDKKGVILLNTGHKHMEPLE